MSAVISRAAGVLTDTHSRWMTLIWEITVHTHASAPVPESHDHTRQMNGSTPHQSLTYCRHTHGRARAHTYTHTDTHTHTQPLDRMSRLQSSCYLRAFDIEIHLESGVSGLRGRGWVQGERERGRDKRNQF